MLLQPRKLDIPEPATAKDMQMMLDTPYEGPLSQSDRQRVINKVAACLDSPFASSRYPGAFSTTCSETRAPTVNLCRVSISPGYISSLGRPRMQDVLTSKVGQIRTMLKTYVKFQGSASLSLMH